MKQLLKFHFFKADIEKTHFSSLHKSQCKMPYLIQKYFLLLVHWSISILMIFKCQLVNKQMTTITYNR